MSGTELAEYVRMNRIDYSRHLFKKHGLKSKETK